MITKANKFLNWIYFLLFFLLSIFIITEPNIGKNAAIKGILLCGRVIIPSLFTFSVIILFLMKLLPNLIKGKEKVFIILFSLLGGYPIGAKLLNNCIKEKTLKEKDAKRMLNYCVNAGPAFIIGAVGCGILSSTKAGYILFFSHIMSSFIISLLLHKRNEKTTLVATIGKSNFSFTESFTQSVTDAASMIIGICSYVILFSVLSEYLFHFSKTNPIFRYLGFFLEVTRGVTQTNNIYFISFLLGFSGICIWCQILSAGKLIKIKLSVFILFRILHGLLSSTLTFLLIKIFKISLPCFSNSVNYQSVFFYSTPIFSISLFCLGIIFIISLFSKKYSGNLLDDML